MGSPVNIGDAIAILTQIHNIYEAYRNTPDELRRALTKFEDVERECVVLNQVLATSQRQQYRCYPRSPQLVKDLRKARDFFEQFKPLTDQSGDRVQLTVKVKKTFSAKWHGSQVKDHVAKIEMHREDMKDFKQIVLIQAAQDNIDLSMHAIGLQLDGRANHSQIRRLTIQNGATASSLDRISILEKASRTLAVARQLEREPSQRRQLRLPLVAEATFAPITRNGMDASDDLKQEVADFVERTGLYETNRYQLASEEILGQLAEMPAQWYQLQQEPAHQCTDSGLPGILSQRKVVAVSPIPDARRPPETNLQMQEIQEDTVSISESWTNALGTVEYGQVKPRLSSFAQRESLNRDTDTTTAHDNAIIHSATGKENDSATYDEVMVMAPWTAWPLPCRLKLMILPGSLHIQASTTEKFRPDALPPFGGNVARRHSSLLQHHNDERQTIQDVPLVFTHVIHEAASSFPKVLHPSAEAHTNGANSYPYGIQFYQQQRLQVQRYPQLPEDVKGLSYVFKHKRDRDAVREKIFGKHLLASVGIATVEFYRSSLTPCGTQAASLWKMHSDQGRQDVPASNQVELTITLQCSSKGKRTEPDCAIEFLILNVVSKDIDKIRQHEGKELELELQLIRNENPEWSVNDMSGGILSSSSTASNVSYVSGRSQSSTEPPSSPNAGSRRGSFLSKIRTSSVASADTTKPWTSMRCYLKFSEGTPNLDRAKATFLNALQKNLKKR